MEDYIVALISAVASFIAAYLGACLALKNVKKEKYFEERKRLYYELAGILPITDEFIAQSDYLQDYDCGGNAKQKIEIMKMRLQDAEERLKIKKVGKYTSKEIYEIETEISNWKYIIKKHKEYLQEMEELHKKLEAFDKSGKKNLLRLFASAEVWSSYVHFEVALHNEYYCNIGVKKDDIVYHINNLILGMRNDLQG